MNFDYQDSHGAVVCSVKLTHLWADVYGIIQKTEKENIEPPIWLALIAQAIEEARKKKPGNSSFESKKTGVEALANKLSGLGFRKKQDRIEFRIKISELPTGEGSPIEWRTAHDLGYQNGNVTDLFMEVADGDPDSEPMGDPLVYVQDWLKDPVLTSGPKCITVGFLEGVPCALVVAQINPKSKWSRISYMGIAPKLRGKGLGRWVHRQGFEMMSLRMENGWTTSFM